jgi:hypothetical protein
MTDEPKRGPEEGSGNPAAGVSPEVALGDLRRFPGMAAIGIYMLFLAGTVILGVATKHFPLLYLIFPMLFIAAGFGLLMMFRWAWALTLGAVGLLMAAFLYQFARQHAGFALVQGLLNLVFFFYLVRAEIRESLR